MVVEAVELEQGRSLAELTASLELHGGRLVVLQWRRAGPTLASVFLPEHGERQMTCRRLIAEWRSASTGSDLETGGYTWPVGHPRHKLDFGVQ
jgi:hypothetical protein